MTHKPFAEIDPALEGANLAATPVPVKFGGSFNMDPALLVLPEGVDQAAISGASGQALSFSSELLSALTPGLPAGEMVARPEGMENVDPRLIAAGLDPAQMEKILASLAEHNRPAPQGVPFQQAQIPAVTTVANAQLPAPVVAPSGDVAIATVVFQPAPTGTTINSQAALSDVVVKTTAPVTESGALDSMITTEDGFDPLEFRLAQKPSRYNSVAPFVVSAATAEVSGSQTTSTPTAAAPQVVKGQMNQQAQVDATPAFTSAFADASNGLLPDSGLLANDGAMVSATGSALPVQLNTLTNSVLQNVTATQSHPATQAVAAAMNKLAQNGSSSQTLAIQLDPPDLGRVHLKMKIEKGEPLKVHIVLEKADAFALLQRDAHALENALNQAGIKTDSSTLSFDLARDQTAFQQAMSDGGRGNNQNGQSWSASQSGMSGNEVEDTRMMVFTDPETGLVHYNIYA